MLKVCGILVENIISGSKVKTSIIGIGLNVNQTEFSHYLKATSIKKELKHEQNLEALLKRILEKLQVFLLQIDVINKIELYREYEKVLFRKDKVSTFQKPDGSVFTGIISGISSKGELRLKLEDDTYEEFGLKKIKLLY
jgi:BirA family biotin operon repressor/biotin-[acetyl-CoA-carboxylase] ligase